MATTLPQVVPVFPLPRVVFFPRTVLPLHVFEPRYRDLVRDAAAGNGLFAVSLLRPGWEEDYEGSPAFEPIATVGRLEGLHGLPDGRSLLRLIGIQRVRLEETPSKHTYRVARIDPRPETGVDESDPKLQEAKRALLAGHGTLARLLSDSGDETFFLDDSLSFEEVVNAVSASLPVEPPVRQDLLEINDLLERQRRASERLDKVLETAYSLRAAKDGEGEGGAVN